MSLVVSGSKSFISKSYEYILKALVETLIGQRKRPPQPRPSSVDQRLTL
jgi:hypothetical protein